MCIADSQIISNNVKNANAAMCYSTHVIDLYSEILTGNRRFYLMNHHAKKVTANFINKAKAFYRKTFFFNLTINLMCLVNHKSSGYRNHHQK